MGAKALNLPHYTYEDYIHWEGRWELIHGIPFAMSPLPVPEHQRIGGKLFSIFHGQLSDQRDNCMAYPPIDWKVKADTVLQPDFLIVCGKIEKQYLDFPPSLVAEILSPSTTLKDRNDKFIVYEAEHVRYYMILDINVKRLEIFEQIDGKYEPVSVDPPSFDFTFHEDCKIPVSFSELWE